MVKCMPRALVSGAAEVTRNNDMFGATGKSDSRSQTKDKKRVVDKKCKWNRKWAYGLAYGGPAPVKSGTNGTVRPVNLRNNVFDINQAKQERRRVNAERKRLPMLNNDEPYTHSDSSADERALVDSDVPYTNLDEIRYSFDVSHGPATGKQVLCNAVDRAVAKFEEDRVNKLVHDEYEFLEYDAEDEVVETSEDDDGFELI